MKVSAIQCSNCLDIIYSRTRHDYNVCSCWNTDILSYGVTIDGGFDYYIIGWGNDMDKPDIFELHIGTNVTKKMLYDDWNQSKNKYGRIKINTN